MGYVFVSPEWFLGYDILLEVLFAIVTFLVSAYAWQIYKVTSERNIKLFSWAFFFIGLSYVAQALLNTVLMYKLDSQICGAIRMQNLFLFNLFGVYIHATLFLIGLLLLAYISLKIYSLRTFILMFLLIFTSLYFSPHKTFMLYMLSSLLLGFISYYYLQNYLANKKKTSLMVAVSMILLFIAHLYLVFATENRLYYAIGHGIEFISYLLVLSGLFLVLRVGSVGVGRKNGKKKR